MAFDLTEWHGKGSKELGALSAPQLLRLLELSRSRATCSCGRDCGDEYINQAGRDFNQKQFELSVRAKAALAGREHVPSRAEGKAARRERQARPERKVLKY